MPRRKRIRWCVLSAAVDYAEVVTRELSATASNFTVFYFTQMVATSEASVPTMKSDVGST